MLLDYKQFINNMSDNILMICDDLAADKFFTTESVGKFVFNSRHRKVSLIITTQSYKCISKKIRLNNSQLVLFETGNEKELKDIYEENCCKLNFNEFMELYKYCTDIPFGFIVVNYQNLKNFRFQMMFQSFFDLQ